MIQSSFVVSCDRGCHVGNGFGSRQVDILGLTLSCSWGRMCVSQCELKAEELMSEPERRKVFYGGHQGETTVLSLCDGGTVERLCRVQR